MNDPIQVKIKALDCQPYVKDELKSIRLPTSNYHWDLIHIHCSCQHQLHCRWKAEQNEEYLGIIDVRWYLSFIGCLLRSLVVDLLLSTCVTILGSTEITRILPKSTFSHKQWSVVFVTCLIYSLQVSLFTLLYGQQT